MYNDKIAIKKFKEFAEEHKIKSVFETGTWKGDGTLWFLEYVDEVITVEIDAVFFVEAQKKWTTKGFKEVFRGKTNKDEAKYVIFEKDNKKIHHLFGDSVEVLDMVLKKYKETILEPCLFYLDAHWDWNQPQLFIFWPIIKELQVLAKYKMGHSPIIIHDVKHPTKDFGYDELFGQALDIDYLRKDILKINPNYKYFHNDEVRDKTNGRGILYIAP